MRNFPHENFCEIPERFSLMLDLVKEYDKSFKKIEIFAF